MSWNAGQVLQIVVDEDEDDIRLDRWMKRKFHGLTQGQLEKMLRKGEIRVDGARAKSSSRLKPGQTVRVPPVQRSGAGGVVDADGETAGADDAPWRTSSAGVHSDDAAMIRDAVIYEDDRIIAINKPFGLAVQGGTGTKRHVDGLSRALVPPGAEKPRLVHRLDRDTTGVLVMAKTPGAAAELGVLFRSRDLQKVYWAVTLGVPTPHDGEVRCWMIKAMGPGADKEKMRRAAHGEQGAVHSVTQYSIVANAGQKAAWVAMKPVTGRTHQLRFHMSELGCAILGDFKYTCDRPAPGGVADGLHLHARALRLPLKGGKVVDLVAELPKHMQTTFDVLGFDPGDVKDPFFSLVRTRTR